MIIKTTFMTRKDAVQLFEDKKVRTLWDCFASSIFGPER